VIARTALRPERMPFQKHSRPTPKGETTPMPVMETRGVLIVANRTLYYVCRMQHAARLAYVWLGGAVFVGSLLYFLWFYLVQLDRVPGGGGLLALTINVSLFSLFAVHHSVMARSGAKRWITRLMPAELERSTYSWISSLLFILACAGWQPIGGTIYEARDWLAVPFRLVQLTGIVIVARATAALDALDLAGIRQLDRQAKDTPLGLKTSGVYGLVRHPIYLGWAMFVFGAPRMTTDRAVFAIISTLYLALAVPLEERSLVQTFGEAYSRYADKVRWKIVPGVY
jgi:protein-S-isoprenylcysteine O-methyltransferase Ste14